MRFLRFLCNFLMFIAISIVISLLQVGIFNFVSLQSEDVEAIHVSESKDTDVTYFDVYTFWAEDIGANLAQGPKYRVRNWASWGWWKKGMKWADVAIDAVIATVKPVIVPIAQVNAIKNYHGYSINDFNDYLRKAYETDEEYNNALYELYVIFEKGYETAKTFEETPRNISEWEYSGELTVEDIDIEYARWVKKNKKLFNTTWKLEKYNREEYSRYFKKFISYDKIDNKYENRHIKTAAIVMYYQSYVSLIIALAFTIRYPISFVQLRTVGTRRTKKNEEIGTH